MNDIEGDVIISAEGVTALYEMLRGNGHLDGCTQFDPCHACLLREQLKEELRPRRYQMLLETLERPIRRTPVDDILVQNLGLRKLTSNAIRAHGILTYGQLRDFPPERYRQIRRFSDSCIREVTERLSELDVLLARPKAA